jgi:hypothetical protein
MNNEGRKAHLIGPKKHNVTAGDTESPLEEIVVTGTYIRGVAPASPVITITSTDIENSGASTAGEVLRELPESFAGGQQSTIGTNGAGPYQNLGNFSYSTAQIFVASARIRRSCS